MIVYYCTSTFPLTQYFQLFLSTEIGTFPWPWEKKGKPSALDEYGLGLVFYFKLVRSLAIIFALISAITVPSMAIFISAKVLNTSDQYYEVVTQSERLLGSKVSIIVRYNS